MTELDDQLDEGRAAVARMDPPGDLWDQALDRAHADGPAILDLIDDRRRRLSTWLAAAAVAACLLAVAAVAVVVTPEGRNVVTVPQTDPSAPAPTATTTSTGGGSAVLAKGEDLRIVEADGTGRRRLEIDAEQHDGEVSGTFKVDGVVVAIQCAGTETGGRDLILGGTVTEDHDDQGLATFDDEVAVGDVIALAIRERAGFDERVFLLTEDREASCSELVESLPWNHDGGFFRQVSGDIKIGRLEAYPALLAKAEDMVFGATSNRLNIFAEEKDDVATGEIRVDDVVVRVQCADTNPNDGELRLGGTVIADPAGSGLDVLDGGAPGDAPPSPAKARVGDRVALILREDQDRVSRVALYTDGWRGTCAEFVDSIRDLDGSFFARAAGGTGLDTRENP